jgi:copper oxidase (laccase) domain-containing protein
MEKIARRYGAKWHIDLPEANRLQLLACDLLPENIILSGVCTYTSHDVFFSARRLGIKSGRIFNGIMVK